MGEQDKPAPGDVGGGGAPVMPDYVADLKEIENLCRIMGIVDEPWAQFDLRPARAGVVNGRFMWWYNLTWRNRLIRGGMTSEMSLDKVKELILAEVKRHQEGPPKYPGAAFANYASSHTSYYPYQNLPYKVTQGDVDDE